MSFDIFDVAQAVVDVVGDIFLLTVGMGLAIFVGIGVLNLSGFHVVGGGNVVGVEGLDMLEHHVAHFVGELVAERLDDELFVFVVVFVFVVAFDFDFDVFGNRVIVVEVVV